MCAIVSHDGQMSDKPKQKQPAASGGFQAPKSHMPAWQAAASSIGAVGTV